MTPPPPKPAAAVREWTVEDLGFDGLWLSPGFNKELCPIKVVESSHYTELLALCREMAAAFEYYQSAWDTGHKAKAALQRAREMGLVE